MKALVLFFNKSNRYNERYAGIGRNDKWIVGELDPFGYITDNQIDAELHGEGAAFDTLSEALAALQRLAEEP